MSTLDRLRTRVRDHMIRRDAALTSSDTLVDEFLTGAVTRICNLLDAKHMETETTMTVASNAVTLPADCVGIVDVHYASTPNRSLVQVPWAEFRSLSAWDATDTTGPIYFVHRNGVLEFAPDVADGESIGLIYLAALALPGAGGSTNTLFTEAPDLVLYDAVRRGCIRFSDPERAAEFDLLFQSEFSDYQTRIERLKTKGKKAAIRPGHNVAAY